MEYKEEREEGGGLRLLVPCVYLCSFSFFSPFWSNLILRLYTFPPKRRLLWRPPKQALRTEAQVHNETSQNNRTQNTAAAPDSTMPAYQAADPTLPPERAAAASAATSAASAA
eukprot:Rhum_TRINITY_DN16726_c0_g1::Rhum_TRINITY_DN16726_c0_g1_i1::g.164184::m.164184